MPVTPLHYPISYLLKRVNSRLSLPAMAVGAVIPDLEVPILFFFFRGVFLDHFILHSLLGALTLGLGISLLTVRYLYAPIASNIFGIERELANEESKITGIVVVSAIIGILSHLLLDVTYHWYNPIFWPIVDPLLVVGPLAIVFALDGSVKSTGFLLANALLNTIMSALWFLIILEEKDRGIWYGLLVGEHPTDING
ncbi:DUF4184 family protein [Candidatus Thorarchaeota archaeon]|nr:MAG: DUF4184 family protein [Candidatus Thorarchaeota archaeon]